MPALLSCVASLGTRNERGFCFMLRYKKEKKKKKDLAILILNSDAFNNTYKLIGFHAQHSKAL